MLGIKLGIYWKFSWGIFIPLSLLTIFVYSLATFEPLRSGSYVLPTALTSAGWVLAAIALLQVPLWAFMAMYKRKGSMIDVSVLKKSILLKKKNVI